MRKYFFILFLALVSCQQTSQDKAEAAVKKHLLETLHDPRSYQSVAFGKLDSTYQFVDSLKYWSYRIAHTYRAKNGLGALIITTDTFKVMPIGEDLRVYY